MYKHERQNTLAEMIASRAIRSQSELASLLNAKGFKVTQASVSRDLDELGIIKQNGRYVLTPRTNDGPEFGRVSFDTAGDSLIVGRCASGIASAITVRIDSAHIPKIVGTIAGDDTIFIAVKNAESQSSVMTTITVMFNCGELI